MPYSCLAQLLEALADAGQLARIDPPVDPKLEVAAVTQRVVSGGGPALLFAQVAGSELPVLTNLLGSEERIARSLGLSGLDELAGRVGKLIGPSGAAGWLQSVGLGAGESLAKYRPKPVRTAPCQQVVRLGHDIDLAEFPFIRSCPQEAVPVVTGATLWSSHRGRGEMVVGQHPLQVIGRDELAVCWSSHHRLARLQVAYARREENMPVAVVLGGHPAGTLASAAPLPCRTDLARVAGWLAGRPEEVVRCRTIDLSVPAEAEIVIEGYVEAGGPVAEPGWVMISGGQLCRVDRAPRIKVTAVTHRANAVCPVMVPGQPPDEPMVVRRAMWHAFFPVVQAAIPDLLDYEFPLFGSARDWAFLSIDKTYPGQAQRVVQALWGLDALMGTKAVVVVDGQVDVHQPSEVWAAVARHMDPARDVWFGKGPGQWWEGGAVATRMAIDATSKLPEEGERAPAAGGQGWQEVLRRVQQRWQEYGIR